MVKNAEYKTIKLRRLKDWHASALGDLQAVYEESKPVTDIKIETTFLIPFLNSIDPFDPEKVMQKGKLCNEQEQKFTAIEHVGNKSNCR